MFSIKTNVDASFSLSIKHISLQILAIGAYFTSPILLALFCPNSEVKTFPPKLCPIPPSCPISAIGAVFSEFRHGRLLSELCLWTPFLRVLRIDAFSPNSAH